MTIHIFFLLVDRIKIIMNTFGITCNTRVNYTTLGGGFRIQFLVDLRLKV